MSHSDLIKSGRVYLVNLPVTETHSHGTGDIVGIKSVILEIITESGQIGWGEASPWAVFTGTAEGNKAALESYFIPALIGRSVMDVDVIMTELERMVVHCSEAKAAVEMALLDLKGKMLGLRVCDLLGGGLSGKISDEFFGG